MKRDIREVLLPRQSLQLRGRGLGPVGLCSCLPQAFTWRLGDFKAALPMQCGSPQTFRLALCLP